MITHGSELLYLRIVSACIYRMIKYKVHVWYEFMWKRQYTQKEIVSDAWKQEKTKQNKTK